jgi:hypothetical protein
MIQVFAFVIQVHACIMQVHAKGKHLLQLPAKGLIMAHRDSQTGQYNETYPLKVFVEAVNQLGGDVGTKAVEEAVGCEYRTAIAKLHELEDAGIVSFRRVGNSYLWSLADPGNMEEQIVHREPNLNQEPPEDGGGSSGSSDLYDPTDEWG